MSEGEHARGVAELRELPDGEHGQRGRGEDDDRGEHRPAEVRARAEALLPPPGRGRERQRGEGRDVLAEAERDDPERDQRHRGADLPAAEREPARHGGRGDPPAASAPAPTATAAAAVAHSTASRPDIRGSPVYRCSTQATRRGARHRDGGPQRAVGVRPGGEHERGRQEQSGQPAGAGAQHPYRADGGPGEQQDPGELRWHLGPSSRTRPPERHSATVAPCTTRPASERRSAVSRSSPRCAPSSTGETVAHALVLGGVPGIGKTTLWEAGVAQAARGRAPRPPGPAERGRGRALLRRADRPLRAARRRRARRPAGPAARARSRPRCCAPSPVRGRRGAAGDRARAAQRAARARRGGAGARRDRRRPVARRAVLGRAGLRRPAAATTTRSRSCSPAARAGGRRSCARSSAARLQRLEVGPLERDAIRALLHDRLGLAPAAPAAAADRRGDARQPAVRARARARAASSAAARSRARTLPVPGAVEELLGTRVAALPERGAPRCCSRSRSAASCARPSSTAVGGARPRSRTPRGRRAAVADGSASAPRTRCSPPPRGSAHPPTASGASSTARSPDAVADEELRAHHLALATDRARRGARRRRSPRPRPAPPPAAPAGEAVAAGRAGAPAHAARRPERARARARARRLPGDGRRARSGSPTCCARGRRAPAPGARASARGSCSSDGAGVDTLRRARQRHLEARAGGGAATIPTLRATVLAAQALLTAAEGVERLPRREAWAEEALAAEAAGAGRRARRAARARLGAQPARAADRRRLRALHRAAGAGRGDRRRARAPSRGCGTCGAGSSPRRARSSTAIMALADERGEAVSYAWLRLNQCELGLRAGEWDAVERRLDEWAQSGGGTLLVSASHQRCRALLATGRGRRREAAVRWGEPARAAGAASGYTWHAAGGHPRARPRRAARRATQDGLRPCWARSGHTRARARRRRARRVPGRTRPGGGARPEGAAERGRSAVHARLARLAEEQEHPWARAARGALRARRSTRRTRATPRPRSNASACRSTRARCRLAAGRAARRRRKWGAAREQLEAAAAGFDALGSRGWAEQARAELARVGARRPRARGELTPAERRVAELAAGGASTKEIAQALRGERAHGRGPPARGSTRSWASAPARSSPPASPARPTPPGRRRHRLGRAAGRVAQTADQP